jgi:hypothetical protein
MHATGWQAHSIRAYISSTLRKKLGLVVVLEHHESGERRYRTQSPVMPDVHKDGNTVPA